MITTLYECPPPKQIVSGDGWGKAQVFPPPSFLSSTGLSHQGANAAQIHPSPAPTNFTLPHPPLAYHPTHPTNFLLYKKYVTHMYPPLPIWFSLGHTFCYFKDQWDRVFEPWTRRKPVF